VVFQAAAPPSAARCALLAFLAAFAAAAFAFLASALACQKRVVSIFALYSFETRASGTNLLFLSPSPFLLFLPLLFKGFGIHRRAGTTSGFADFLCLSRCLFFLLYAFDPRIQ
jgi:hypothetical protein